MIHTQKVHRQILFVRLQFGALWSFFQGYVLSFFLHVFVIIIIQIVLFLLGKLDYLIGVNVGVEVSHDGEDDADAHQHAGKQQELHPLQPETTSHE